MSHYLADRISGTIKDSSKTKISSEAIGSGEKLPPGVSPSENKNDPNRRICKVYISFRIEEEN